MPDLYETYLRDKDGSTYHPSNIREGLRTFLSDNGYRISFNIDGVVITLRRDASVDNDMKFFDEQLGSDSVNCVITLRGHK